MSARHIGSESGKQVTQKVPLELIDRQMDTWESVSTALVWKT